MTDTPLRLLLDFDAFSQRDHHQPPAFLHRRDRKFALTCEQQGRTPNARLWLEHMARLSGPGADRSAGDKAIRLWRRINTGFVLVGGLLGILTMLGLLFYDGGQRINITAFLAFVMLQLLLALFTTVQSIAGWQPWRWLTKRLNRGSTSDTVHRLQPALMARASHLGGLSFATTGLLTLLVMVVVQDLAFGWSTTLNTAADRYHQLILWVSVPWHWVWPAAVPDLALVEATRFFRAGGQSNAVNPEQWGQWWPFVVALWGVWVLLPRLALSLFSALVIRGKARQLLNNHPAMHALMYRMETPTIDTGNEHNDAGDMPDTSTPTGLSPLPASNLILAWAGADKPELPQGLMGPDTQVFGAGGRATLAEDHRAIGHIAEALAGQPGGAVLVVTRSWEPPTGELQDFLETALETWPPHVVVHLVPLSPDPNQPPDDRQLRQWLRFAHRTGGDGIGVSILPGTPQDPYVIREQVL
ncbi:DUF2868 domain-containing protein [Marinobacter salinisoli]|uniref:DUF2868 domain-containing protein n=1 Tax=Marinobacter salinisoli TaxID=2769486 RepID=A0ABX7MTC1_9GAMM|nr:DUF2868 domain-containing protein [Marinobacter salinisoli]QSP95632.1 DUF2868 domain-containing protein [Marinobacter salinisoli]